MVVDDFKKIVPYMKDVENVVLEGWGESLMHKDLIQCIHLVKKEGSRVGFVTSGSGSVSYTHLTLPTIYSV